MSNKNNVRNKFELFKFLECILITIGIIGLLFCSLFFIINQININSAFQDLKNCPQNLVIERAEYIKKLSEAQSAASTKDIISLLYGFLSSAFIAMGLHFLKESQQATKDTKAFAEDVKEKHDEIYDCYIKISKKDEELKNNIENLKNELEDLRKKHKEICDYHSKILENDEELKKIIVNSNMEYSTRQEAQRCFILLQNYIDQIISSCHSIELLTVMVSDFLLVNVGIKEITYERKISMIYRLLPRIRDSLRCADHFELGNSILTKTNIDLLILGVNEIVASLKKIIKYMNDVPDLEEFNGTWDEFLEYCSSIKNNLNKMRSTK